MGGGRNAAQLAELKRLVFIAGTDTLAENRWRDKPGRYEQHNLDRAGGGPAVWFLGTGAPETQPAASAQLPISAE
jgi:hypothetical protein